MTDYISLALRNWWKILLFMVLGGVIAFVFLMKNSHPSVDHTVFVSIGAEVPSQQAATTSTFELVQSADFFTETVQGWFKNPEFQRRVATKSGVPTNVSARKQEKQNLVLSFSTSSLEDGGKYSEVLHNVLLQDITSYNEKTNSRFEMTLFDLTSETHTENWLVVIIFGKLFGLFLGFLVVFFFDKLFGIMSFRQQASHVVPEEQIFVLQKNKPEQLSYLFAGARERLENKKGSVQVWLVNFHDVKLPHTLKEYSAGQKVEVLEAPTEVSEYDSQAIAIIILRLGTSRQQDFMNLWHLTRGKALVAILS